jgi:thiol-disulfide isomerase/thioredoxin
LLLLRTIENLRSSNISLRPASDFEVKDLNGKIHKLSDYRGKVVYLDFWSTTCAPCIAEIPALNALIEKYQGRDVVFLSVAFDSNHDRLNRFLAKKPINGTVLVEEKGFGSKVAGDYQIQSIPRYCVIDKVGNLLNDNAPRPSSKPDDIIDAALMH